MEWLWLLVVVPLVNLWRALAGAWGRLLEASSEEERQEIITQAGAQALVNTLLALVVGFAPLPYNLLGLIPAVLPFIGRLFGTMIHISFMYKGRRL